MEGSSNAFFSVGWMILFWDMAVGHMLFFFFFLEILALQQSQAHSFPEYDGLQLDKHGVIINIKSDPELVDKTVWHLQKKKKKSCRLSKEHNAGGMRERKRQKLLSAFI